MTDDDLWNLILGNNSNGPSVTPFANTAGPNSPGAGSPPSSASSLIDAWKSTGLGGDTLAMLLPQLDDASMPPQRQDTGAALLPQSALAPAHPLQDPTPFQLPEMTMDQAALAYGMTPEQLAEIHKDAIRQVGINIVGAGLLGGVADTGLEIIEVPALLRNLASGGMILHDGLDFSQQLQDAPGQAIFKNLNDSEIQSIPSTAKAWLP